MSEKKPSVASRGIPSKESMYLPAHYSNELRKFQDDNETPMKNYWTIEEILNFVFPKKYQEKYNETANLFIKTLYEKVEMDGNDMGEFIRQNDVSKATFYNRVLPRLKRIGMIKVYRETVDSKQSKRKYRPMRITISKTFGNYINKIGDSWLAIVDNARTKR